MYKVIRGNCARALLARLEWKAARVLAPWDKELVGGDGQRWNSRRSCVTGISIIELQWARSTKRISVVLIHVSQYRRSRRGSRVLSFLSDITGWEEGDSRKPMSIQQYSTFSNKYYYYITFTKRVRGFNNTLPARLDFLFSRGRQNNNTPSDSEAGRG